VKHHGEFFCNNVYLGSAKTHSKNGVPVKAFEYDGIIPEGKFFAMGTCPDSYDSRYVGLENKHDIKAVAVPLF
jgi:type IV secretory pathway protease TraF